MLLFLANVSDPFLALDGAGAPLAGATLQFYKSGTTAQQPVYSDSGLSSPISQPITADSAGEFATIYLDPDLTYRAVLKRATGALVWDVDPYEIDEFEAGRNLFRGPKVQALVAGVPQAGATMTFFTTETSAKRDIFADADLATPLPNPITADAGGFFPPIYMSGDYKVVPSWTDEIDPYPPASPPTLTVTIASLGGDFFGFTASGGSVDPDPAEIGAITVEGLFGNASFFFMDTDSGLPAGFDSIEVETTDAGVFEPLAFGDATEVEPNTFRWSNNVIQWNDAESSDRDVRFV